MIHTAEDAVRLSDAWPVREKAFEACRQGPIGRAEASVDVHRKQPFCTPESLRIRDYEDNP
jgi:hypothetical protein